ncbi:MAG: N-6 DNA methylase [Dysgonamonadaceae bacterium]|nr:N-6 DNA methylase [Dysgonamonadaceae bacterium]
MTKKDKLTGNIAAIDTVLRLEKNGQAPGPEDKKTLLQYHGFGDLKCILLSPERPEQFAETERNLIPYVRQLQDVIRTYSSTSREYLDFYDSLKRSVLTSFYTPQAIVQALSGSFENNRLSFANILDPSAGMGIFLSLKGEHYTAVERDIITGKILKILNPDKDVRIEGFENLPAGYNQSFNLVTSNIPFGDYKVFDPALLNSRNIERMKACSTVHTYFFEKGLDMLRNGGILAFVTSTGVMDSPGHESFRKHLLTGSHLIAAVRLPEDTFDSTKVQSDLIILQRDSKRHTQLSDRELRFIRTATLQEGMHLNAYYADDAFSHVIHTSYTTGTDLYGKPGIRFYHEEGITGIARETGKFLSYDIRENINRKLFNSTNRPAEKAVPVQLSFFDTLNEYVNAPAKARTDIFEYKNSAYSVAGSYQYAGDRIGVAKDEKTAKELDTGNKQDREIIRQYADIRDSYFYLKNEEAKTLHEAPELRRELNAAYDGFVSRHSFLSSHYKLLSKDPAFLEVLSLEIRRDGEIKKADIFFAPVAFTTPKEQYTLPDALSVCLNRFNRVDIDYISSLARLNEEDVVNGLEGMIYKNPQTYGYETADVFLSGNVILKLDKAVEESNRHPADRHLLNAVKALQQVVPTKIPLEDIAVGLGERWIPDGYYSAFASSLFNVPTEVKYNPILDDFEVKGEYSYSASQKYAVKSVNRFYSSGDVLRFALLDNIPEMTKKVSVGETARTVPDTDAIQKMNATVTLLQNDFKDWINLLPAKDREQLENLYNRRFNCYVKPRFNGIFQTFPGLDRNALGIKDLYPSQKDAVLLLKNQGGGIIDHEVGGGKTLIMCCAAYEMKRLGLANKPCIIGLKANIDQIADTFKKAYPEAKLLYATKNDFTPKTRLEFLNKIQNNNWDCIIMTHDQFKAIPQSLDIQQKIIRDEIRKIEETIVTLEGDNYRALEKGLLKRKENLEVKLKGIMYALEQKRDDTVDFKTMGIDHLFVDESHKYKNLMFQTRHQRVAGLGNSDGSERAMNLLFAIRTIQDKTENDLGATFLSGTTISNSLTELYSIFNYLRPGALQEQGIFSFDAWASVFTIKTKDFEFNITNELVQKERFRQFVKVPELAMFYSQITDYRTAEDIGVDRPDKNELLVTLEQTEQQKDMFSRLKEFAKTSDGTIIYRGSLSESEEKAKMLIATNTAKKASLDMRLIAGEFKDEPGNRVHVVAEKIFEYYKKYDVHKGTQFVFSDLGTYKPGYQFNVYSDIKQKLIDGGIPAEEIQFIQMADTENKRKDLFEKMNAGTVRILFGSTEMLGTGVNAQKRCVAIHHFDIPWTPKDLEQRNGRGVRAGNEVAKLHANNRVDVLIYATRETLDTYKFNLISNKALFISQIKNNNISVRSIDEGGLDEKTGMSYGEYIAVLSGNSDLMEKARLEKQITQYKTEENIYLKQIRDRNSNISLLLNEKSKNERYISLFKKDLERFENFPRNAGGEITASVTVGNKRYTDYKRIGEEINKILDNPNTDTTNYHKIGSIGEFNLVTIANMQVTPQGVIYHNKLYVEGHLKYSYQNGNVARSPKLAGEYPLKALNQIGELITAYENKNKEIDSKVNTLGKIEYRFLNKEKLEQATSRLETVTNRINSSIASGKKDGFNLTPL